MRTGIFRLSKAPALVASKLFDQDTFYGVFVSDLKHCSSDVIIESPFITLRRLKMLLPELQVLGKRNVQIIVNTRDPLEYDDYKRQEEAAQAVLDLQQLGVKVLYTIGHHRKLAIIDRKILWEGSLNILSQNDSCEIMRRIESKHLSKQLLQFIGLSNFIK